MEERAASPVAAQLSAQREDEPGARQLSLLDLDGEHRRLLIRAIMKILATEIAETTYAQIIDGLPIADVVDDCQEPPYGQHPVYQAHPELCPGVLEKAREFRAAFRPEVLTFNARLLHSYRACAPGSRRFKTLFIEIVAVAVHQIAALLYSLDTSLHKADGITSWAPPKSDRRYWMFNPSGPLPTLFHHAWYKDYDQYPRGVADMVGYWAEARILGGVVLFDRRDPEADPAADPDAVYFHSDRYDTTYRIYQLLPDQRSALLDFLLTPPSSSPSPSPASNPLPVLGTRANGVRVDPEEPIGETGIYRDLWERRHHPPGEADLRLRDVISRVDFHTREDHRAAQRRAREMRERWRRGERERVGREEEESKSEEGGGEGEEGGGRGRTGDSDEEEKGGEDEATREEEGPRDVEGEEREEDTAGKGEERREGNQGGEVGSEV